MRSGIKALAPLMIAAITLAVVALYLVATSTAAQQAVLMFGLASGAPKAITVDASGNMNVKLVSGGATPCTTTALSVQYNNAGAFGCISGTTSDGTNVTALAMKGAVTWATGAGAIVHITTPSDQTGVISSGSGRALRLAANNNSTQVELTSAGSFHSVSSSLNDVLGSSNFLSYQVNGVLVCSSTAPTISSGFGTSPSVDANPNGNCDFSINVGTGGAATSGVIGLPTAAHGWNCTSFDFTTLNTGTRQTADSTTSATITTNSAWTASDHLRLQCKAY